MPPPQARFYERLVAGDADEAGAILRQASTDPDLATLSDLLVLPTLLRLAQDRESGARSPARIAIILDLLGELLDEVAAALPRARGPAAHDITLVAMRDVATERFAVDWLGRWIEHAALARSVTVRDARHQQLGTAPGMLVLSALTAGSARRALHLLESVRQSGEEARIVLGFWGATRRTRLPADVACVHTSAELAAVLGASDSAHEGMKAAALA
jgi:hypothetical protein